MTLKRNLNKNQNNRFFFFQNLRVEPRFKVPVKQVLYLMFIGPCIIAIVERKTNLMSLATLFHLLRAQHVSDINISIFRSLRLCWWIITYVVLFSVRCVLEFLLRLIFGGVRFAGWNTSASTCKTNTTKYQPQQKLQHTTNWEQDDRSGNSSTQSQAPEDGYINVRNCFNLQNEHHQISAAAKAPTHNELRTRRPMW